jgi:heptosyltransferase II
MRILVRGTNWIGDAVMTIPAIRKLRDLFPEAQMTLLTREWARDIFGESGLFDEIITTGSLISEGGGLRARRFDLAVVFPNSFKSALSVRLGGAKRSFGFAAEHRSWLLTDPVAVPTWKNSRHEVLFYLELVAAVEKSFFNRGTKPDDLTPRLSVPDARQSQARELLHGAGVDVSRKTIALAAGSTNSRAKRWLPERFAELNDRLQTELNANVLLLGAGEERDVSKRVFELSRLKPIDLTGETDLAGAAAVLSEIDMLVSNDMGLAHLAPAVGTKTVVIFGPTNPVTTRPFSDQASIVSAGVECSPCMLRECPIDHRCMTRVSADEVFERVKARLFEEIRGPDSVI